MTRPSNPAPAQVAPPVSPLAPLFSLAHELGREDRRLAILGEGNVSARFTRAGVEPGNSFFVKASGSNLATLSAEGVTECRLDGLLAALEAPAMSDAEVETALLASRIAGEAARKPSVEAMFHAWLLTLPGVSFVGHTHPVAVNAILCSERAGEFAAYRLFPDEIVCCGAASVIVPYVDPGLVLAQEIRSAVLAFIQKHAQPPRVILLENHGLIALGATAPAVLATTLMATKAAETFLGAASLGGPRFLSAEQVARIAGRRDEHYREKVLGLR